MTNIKLERMKIQMMLEKIAVKKAPGLVRVAKNTRIVLDQILKKTTTLIKLEKY